VEHLRQKGGALINLGSVASDIALPLQGMYCASKHAVAGFTEALRMELLEKQAPVGVTLIKPTSVDSPIVHHARNYMDHEPSLPPPLYPPEEVAEAILYAAVHPRREIYVGGPGKAISTFRSVAPSFYESLVPAISSFERRSEMPHAPSGTLHRSKSAGQTRGNPPGLSEHRAYIRALDCTPSRQRPWLPVSPPQLPRSWWLPAKENGTDRKYRLIGDLAVRLFGMSRVRP
jgi:hypothetical protein